MPHFYQLVVHHNKNQSTFLFETTDQSEQKEISNESISLQDRTQLSDAIFFRELQVMLTHRFLVGKTPSSEDYKNLMLLLKSLYAFDMYTPFNAEYAKKHSDALVPRGTHVTHGLPQPQKDTRRTSYALISTLQDQAAPRQNYFKKLGVTPQNNTKAPEGYLMQNLAGAEQDKLLHVRQCEHPDCTLHPLSSDFIAGINNHLRDAVIKYITKYHPNKNEVIYYGGFASGNLKRDLDIIQELIQLGYKNFVFFFLDTDYANLIKLIDDPSALSLQDEAKVRMIHKAILEFSEWIAAHVNCDKKFPVEIHLFGNIQEAEYYFKNCKKKLTLLVGQDFWTRNGCEFPLTPDAHDHFMRLAKVGLEEVKKGRSFELIKQDIQRKIYFHGGQKDAGKYEPSITEEFDPISKTRTIYYGASLGLFAPECRDDSIPLGKKDRWILFDEKDEILKASHPELISSRKK